MGNTVNLGQSNHNFLTTWPISSLFLASKDAHVRAAQNSDERLAQDRTPRSASEMQQACWLDNVSRCNQNMFHVSDHAQSAEGCAARGRPCGMQRDLANQPAIKTENVHLILGPGANC